MERREEGEQEQSGRELFNVRDGLGSGVHLACFLFMFGIVGYVD